MKFIIDRTNLLRALGHVQSAVERRNTIPILGNVMLRAEKDGVALTTTDMDLEIKETTPAQVQEEGATTAPAQMLYELIKKLPEDQPVNITLEEGQYMMRIEAGRAKFQLNCLDVADFPNLGSGDLDVQFSVPAESMRELIDRTRFAISNDETRYYLNGIYMHEAESNAVPMLRTVATDGHRLARFDIPLPEGAEGMPGIILPRKAVNELRKLIDDTAENIRIQLSENKIRFEFGSAVLTSKLVDGTFPDYQRVIPIGNDKILMVDPGQFAKAVDRVSTLSSDKGRAVKMSLNGQSLTLSANTPNAGSATEEMEVQFEADPIEVGFNARYLLDIAQQIEGTSCKIVMADPASPTLIQDEGEAAALYVLMPLRV